MDSLNLLFGLNTKMCRASENTISETAITYMTRQSTTDKVTDMIKELLMDDGKTQINPDEQKSPDLNLKQITF